MTQAAAFLDLARQIPIVLISAECAIVGVTEAAARLLKSAHTELMGRRWTQVCDNSEVNLRSYLRMCARTRSPLPGAFTRCIDGVTVAFRCNGYAWDAAPGQVLLQIMLREEGHGRFIAMTQKLAALNVEIVQRKATERRLNEALAREQQAQVAADEANRSKDEFLAKLGHELRNPLAPMASALQLMRLRGPELFVRERATMERQMALLTRLVDDLLDVARIARGKMDLEMSVLSVSELLAAATELANPLIQQREHRLHIEAGPEELRLDGDAKRLAQAVSNLLTNAAKYTPPRGDIYLRAESRSGRVRISVRDSGIGIGADLLPRIFDSFVQDHQALDRSQGGLGLGLSIVKSIVALHRGTIEAHSAGLGQGSEFVIQLPAAALPAGESCAVSVEPPMHRSIAHRVLIVDDNEDAAELLCQALRLMGYDVRVAFSSEEALRVLESFVPTVALLDIGLPGMNGYELASHIRASQKELPLLVAVTGYAQPRDREQARLAGFEHHMAKPVDLAQLDEVLRRCCTGSLERRMGTARPPGRSA